MWGTWEIVRLQGQDELVASVSNSANGESKKKINDGILKSLEVRHDGEAVLKRIKERINRHALIHPYSPQAARVDLDLDLYLY